MNSERTLRRFLLALLAAMVASSASAAPANVEQFFGEYQGEAITNHEGEVGKRDLRVKISSTENGFNVNWISVTRRADGKLKRKEYSIDFLPTRRSNIFRSGQGRDMFGNSVPLDPMKGDPYVWARIHDKMLTVHALHVLEDGGYEMQTYVRTRTPHGLHLRYSRVRDGEILRTVEGELLEVK